MPSTGDLPNPGIEPVSLMSLALAGWFLTTSATREVQNYQDIGLTQSVDGSHLLGGQAWPKEAGMLPLEHAQ